MGPQYALLHLLKQGLIVLWEDGVQISQFGQHGVDLFLAFTWAVKEHDQLTVLARILVHLQETKRLEPVQS